MTNKDSKMEAIVRYAKYMTEEQYKGFEKKFKMPVANTLTEWRRLGYLLNKDANGKYVERIGWCYYWMKYDNVPEEKRQYIEKERVADDGTKLAYMGVNLYTIEQVHPAYEYKNKYETLVKNVKTEKVAK